ncbi:MAG: hypothetical protein JNL72_09060 [Flavipsychrobacter sp.]|nr:hypothetical protein [Flavipsychrobacter sp.]
MNPVKQTIRNLISLNIPDNNVRAVTPALLRDVLEQMLDFSEETATGSFQDITTTEAVAEWDVELGSRAFMLLGNDVTLSIENAVQGGLYWIVAQQDSNGGYNLTYPPDSIYEGGQEPQINQQPSAVSILNVFFNGTHYIWLNKGNEAAATLWQQMDW